MTDEKPSSNPNAIPLALVMRAGVPVKVHVRPAYVRAWVVGIRLEAERRAQLKVNRINIAGDEQLRVWPIPADVFWHARGFVFAIVQADNGMTIELESEIDQRTEVTIQFTECKLR